MVSEEGYAYGVIQEKQHQRALRGWFSYSFASEVFAIVSLGLFLPICLEQFARDNGFLAPEKVLPCSSISPLPAGAPAEPEARCLVKLGWFWIDTASFSLYTFSISVALQALTVISMGGIANYPPHRKRALLLFAAIGSAAATCFLILPSSSIFWSFSSLFAMLANVGFGASIVALNAYIPFLARTTKPVVTTMVALQNAQTSSSDPQYRASQDDDSDQPLLPPSAESPEVVSLRTEYDTILSQTISRISSQGMALGYTSGILLLLLTLIPITQMKGSTFSLRLAIGLSGLWWATFTLPAALWLPSTDDASAKSTESRGQFTLRKEILGAWKHLGQMLKWSEVKKLRNTFWFLASWFLLSDAFTTITATAILFAKTELNMTPSQLILIGTIVPSCGILGSIVSPMIQRKTGWTNLKLLVVLVGLISLVPLYGCLGFLPIFRVGGRAGFGGLTTAGEMYGLAVYFGLMYGSFAAYARAFYAELIPPGEEARWYGLYSITDKSSSFVGPLIAGVIADTTGNIRFVFFFLAAVIWLAMPILMTVNVEHGRKDASRYVFGGHTSSHTTRDY